MLANHLYSLCQAMDLRALEQEFFRWVDEQRALFALPAGLQIADADLTALKAQLKHFIHAKMSMDPRERFQSAAAGLAGAMYECVTVADGQGSFAQVRESIHQWQQSFSARLLKHWEHLVAQPDSYFAAIVRDMYANRSASCVAVHARFRNQLPCGIWRNDFLTQNHGQYIQRILRAVRGGDFLADLEF